MQPPEPMSPLEEVRIVNREEGSFQRGEDGQLVVRPLDRRERRAHGVDLLAVVKGFAAHQEMRNAARLDRVDVGARDVACKAREPAKQNRNVPRLNGHARFRSVHGTLSDPPSVIGLDQPGDQRANGVRQ